MSSGTLGDTVEYAALRVALHLLNGFAWTLFCAGWALDRAGPVLLSSADRLKRYAKDRLDDGEMTNNAPNSKVKAPTEPTISKEAYPSAKEVAQARIKEPLMSEEHPDIKVTNEPTIQINPLSTEPDIVEDDKPVTALNPEEFEENLPVWLADDSLIAEPVTKEPTMNQPLDAEIGSMPSPADDSREVPPEVGNHSEELGAPDGKQGA